MKSTTFHLPLIVVIAGGTWLGWSHHRVAELQTESNELTHRLKNAKTRQQSSSAGPTGRKTALDYKQVDWSLVATELTSGRTQYGIFKTTFKVEEQIRRLTTEELKKGLKALEDSDLEDRIVLAVTRRLLNELLEKDPGHILLHPGQDPRTASYWQSLQLNALGKWAKIAPGEALDWFDSQPPGSFEPGKHQELNHSLISSLVVSDFPVALTRFKAIPASQRFELFEDFNAFGNEWTPKDFAAHDLTFRYAELTRQLPDDKKSSITSPLTWLGEQDRPSGIYNLQKSLKGWGKSHPGPLSMDTFRDYLSKIKPSQAELDLCIDDVVRSNCLHLPDEPEREPDDLRAWLQSELQSHVRSK